MRFPAVITLAAFLGACSQPVTDVADLGQGGIEPAKAVVVTKNEKATAKEAKARCTRAALNEERNFILCEDGPLRKAGVVMALSAPHDPDLTIEDVSKRFDVPSQVFTGIESATYSTLVNTEGKATAHRGKHKAREGLVQIQGKVYDVYQVSANGKNGTIFVERKDAE